MKYSRHRRVSRVCFTGGRPFPTAIRHDLPSAPGMGSDLTGPYTASVRIPIGQGPGDRSLARARGWSLPKAAPGLLQRRWPGEDQPRWGHPGPPGTDRVTGNGRRDALAIAEPGQDFQDLAEGREHPHGPGLIRLDGQPKFLVPPESLSCNGVRDASRVFCEFIDRASGVVDRGLTPAYSCGNSPVPYHRNLVLSFGCAQFPRIWSHDPTGPPVFPESRGTWPRRFGWQTLASVPEKNPEARGIVPTLDAINP